MKCPDCGSHNFDKELVKPENSVNWTCKKCGWFINDRANKKNWQELVKEKESLTEAAISILSKLNMLLQGIGNNKVEDARLALGKIKETEGKNKDFKSVSSYIDSIGSELNNPKLRDISMIKAKVKKEVDNLK